MGAADLGDKPLAPGFEPQRNRLRNHAAIQPCPKIHRCDLRLLSSEPPEIQRDVLMLAANALASSV